MNVVNGSAGIPAGGELRPAACAVRAFRIVLGAPRVFAKTALLPGLLILAIITACNVLPWYELGYSSLFGLFLLTILAVPLSALGLAWLRGSLLELPPRFLAAAPWRRPSLPALLYTAPWVAWMLATPVVLFGVVSALNATGGSRFAVSVIVSFCYIALGLYLAALVNRSAGRVAIIAAAEGGNDIEARLAAAPEKMLSLDIDPDSGVDAGEAKHLAEGLGLSGAAAEQAIAVMRALDKAFTAYDASLIEINPLAVTKDGDLLALDV